MRFAVLGPVAALRDSEPIPLRGKIRQALLAMLVLDHGRIVSRDAMIDRLWEDRPPTTALNTLQSHLSSLRRALGADASLIELRSPGYLLRTAPEAIDLVRFEEASAAGRALRAAGNLDEARDLLQEASALFRGDPLEGLHDFSFARSAATRIREDHLVVIEDRIDIDLELGRHRVLVSELEALAVQHPLRERLAAQLMLALYRSGSQGSALQAYHRTRTYLRDELGLEPGAAIRELEAAVLRHDPSLDPPDRAASRAEAESPGADRRAADRRRAPAPAPAAEATLDVPDWCFQTGSAFVGRAEEIRILADEFGRPTGVRLVTVEGDAGVGKTRLVGEAARRAASVVVHFGRCDEYIGGPFKPWQRIFDDDASVVLDPTADRVLSEVFPGHRSGAPPGGAVAVAVSDPETQRLHLFHAAAQFLSSLAASKRVVIVLDDLQWADQPSLLLLRHLLLESPPMAVTLVATIRGRAPDLLSATIATAQQRGQVTRIQLAGLPSDDLHELLEVNGIAASDEAVDWLQAETLGNPLFVTELLRQLEPGTTLDPNTVDLLGSIRAAVEHRLAAATPTARALIEAAAVLGTLVDGSVCGEVAGFDIVETIAGLDEAGERRLLQAHDDGTFEFVHAVVRDAVYGALDPARRLDLHRRAALVLTARHEAGASDLLAELAWHWSAAGRFGDRHRAVSYHQQAGDQAIRRLGYESASAHYQAAFDLLGPGPADDEIRAALLIAMAISENHAGDVNAGKEACLAAATIAARTQRHDLLIEAALAFGGDAPVGDAHDPRAARLLRQALETPTADDRRAIVAARLARMDYWNMPRAERRQLCDEADAMTLRSGDRQSRACVLTHRYWALNCPDEVADRAATVDALSELARSLDDPELAHEANKCRLHLQLELGDIGAHRTAAELTGLAEQLDQREYRRLALACDAMFAGAQGRYAAAEAFAAASRDLMLLRGHYNHAHAVYLVQAFPWRWMQGRLGEFLSIADLLIEGADRLLWHSFRAWTTAAAGKIDEAADGLKRLDVPAVLAAEPTFDTLALMATASETAIRVGSDDVEVLYSALMPYQDRVCGIGQIACFGAATHHLGVLARAMGDDQRAAAHLRDAVATHRRLGLDAFTALSLAELARLPRAFQEDDPVVLRSEAAALADARGLGRVTEVLSGPTAA
jgi:DNA-binding SARP family transcriptional activator